MAKFERVSHSTMIVFMCPGCGELHGIDAAKWHVEMDADGEITVSPSVLVNGNGRRPDQKRCHSFIKHGKIQFLKDCGHSLAGQTVDLPDTGGV